MGNSLQKIHFTKSEIRVVVFLLLILLSGLAVKLSKNIFTPGRDSFDYKRMDRLSGRSFGGMTGGLRDSNDTRDTGNFSSKEKEISEKTNRLADSLKNSEGKNTKKGGKEEKLKGRVININTAPKEELILLPGVGESTADKILLYRKEHSRFKKPEDIQKIKGIGKKKFEKLKPYITVD
ncbi:MAG: helix-hairpin-helix domain-containing protein [Bacteroidetes bacterium]|nr:helix-hairpin-helix domain-containing protein [Bacteroidota bacterium]